MSKNACLLVKKKQDPDHNLMINSYTLTLSVHHKNSPIHLSRYPANNLVNRDHIKMVKVNYSKGSTA